MILNLGLRLYFNNSLWNFLISPNVAMILLVKSSGVIGWSSKPPPPKKQIMFDIEPRMVNEFWTRILISFEHMSFWHPFLDPKLILTFEGYAR